MNKNASRKFKAGKRVFYRHYRPAVQASLCSIGMQEIKIETASGDILSPTQLSQGTMEQLYWY